MNQKDRNHKFRFFCFIFNFKSVFLIVADYFYYTFSENGSVYSVINSTPFFPHIIEFGTETYVQFNKGYLFNYGSTEGTKPTPFKNQVGGNVVYFLDTIPVEGGNIEDIELIGDIGFPDEDLIFKINGGDIFYIEIRTSTDGAYVDDVYLYKYQEYTPSEGSSDFHYGLQSALNEIRQDDPTLQEGSPNLKLYSGKGLFRIPLCMFNSQKKLQYIYLRENIHWQKIGFQQLIGGSGSTAQPLFFDIAEGETNFGQNPNVQLRSLLAGDGIKLTGGKEFIKISAISDADIDDETGDGDTTLNQKNTTPSTVPS